MTPKLGLRMNENLIDLRASMTDKITNHVTTNDQKWKEFMKRSLANLDTVYSPMSDASDQLIDELLPHINQILLLGIAQAEWGTLRCADRVLARALQTSVDWVNSELEKEPSGLWDDPSPAEHVEFVARVNLPEVGNITRQLITSCLAQSDEVMKLLIWNLKQHATNVITRAIDHEERSDPYPALLSDVVYLAKTSMTDKAKDLLAGVDASMAKILYAHTTEFECNRGWRVML